MSLVSTPADTKVSRPHFLNALSTLLYKKKQYRFKKKLDNRAPSNQETEIPGTGNEVASMTKMRQCADKSSTQLLHYRNAGHCVNKRTVGQKHDWKNKLRNYSKWQNRLIIKHEWHVNCIASRTFQTMHCSFRFGPMSCYDQEHCIYSKAQISMSWIKKSSFLESVWFPNVLQEWLLPW